MLLHIFYLNTNIVRLYFLSQNEQMCHVAYKDYRKYRCNMGSLFFFLTQMSESL